MIKKNTSLMCGISFICLLGCMNVGICGTTDEPIISFDVPIVSGKDGCSATITTDANNCTVITQNARVNGECQATGTPQTVCPGAAGTSCNVSVERIDAQNKVAITKQCGEEEQTVYVNDGEDADVDVDAVATAAAEQLATNKTFATPSDLEALVAKLPSRDASTGAINWTDPNGNSVSYGQYTFWLIDTYNKKINNKWFKCRKYYTDAPSTEYVQNIIETVQCNSGEGWTYGTDCLLDGSITTHASGLNVGAEPNLEYSLCWQIRSGDITTLIDEQVADKGFAQQSSVTSLTERVAAAESSIATKASSSDLAALQQTVADNLTEAKNYVDNKGFATEEYVTNAVATGVNTAGLCPGGTLESRVISSDGEKDTYGVFCVTGTED